MANIACTVPILSSICCQIYFEMFSLNSTLNFGILLVLVFQLEVYYKVDRLLTGLTAQQKGTTARWYSNKTSWTISFNIHLPSTIRRVFIAINYDNFTLYPTLPEGRNKNLICTWYVLKIKIVLYYCLVF